VSPNELKELIERTMELLNVLTRAWDRSVHAFNLGAKEDLVRLLNDIKRLRGTKSDSRLLPPSSQGKR
jgi:hypothetical protein